MNRRDYLKYTALTGLTAISTASGVPVLATESSSKSLPPHMKLSLAAYSFNRSLPRNWPSPRKSDASMSLFDFVDYCAELNLDGCELTSYYFPAEITSGYLAELKRRTFLHGLDITGTAIGNDFCFAEGEERDQQLQLTKDWIDYAAELGAPVIRIFAGKQKKEQSFEEAVELCAAGISEALKHAEKKGVCLALENHGGITATPQQMMQIIDQVTPSPCFGVNFDSGNFRTDDPYRDLEVIAPLAINAQVKVEVYKDEKKVPADLKRIVNILKQAKYRGYLVLEYEAKEDPNAAIPDYVDQLRELIE